MPDRKSLTKDASILGFLARLSAELDPSSWTVVDHWEADLCAIGVASARDPGVLVYVSTWRQPPGRYYCATELPPAPGDDAPYRAAGEKDGVGISEAIALIREHLSGVDRP